MLMPGCVGIRGKRYQIMGVKSNLKTKGSLIFNSQTKFVILLTVDHTILIMLVQRI